MRREIIILTKSDKNNGYCVAGVDRNNGEFIRLVSDHEESDYSLLEEHILYHNGEALNVMDIVSVEVMENQNCWYQPENYKIDTNTFERIGVATAEDIQEYLMDDLNYIFYNSDKKVEPQMIKSSNNKISLALVYVDELKLWKDMHKHNKINVNFEFNGQDYKFIKLTDSILYERYIDEVEECSPKPLVLYNVAIVMSLAGAYEFDGNHYKLVANIIENVNNPDCIYF
ncbi:hypothetical protein AAIB48_19325 [Paraclostridium benzoelyticum]|uniref:dual OB domain-containing protein n=1 Tax=Paraclostridium benzoelyticum TaxID=1629550 RepID=UPI0031CD9B6D